MHVQLAAVPRTESNWLVTCVLSIDLGAWCFTHWLLNPSSVPAELKGKEKQQFFYFVGWIVRADHGFRKGESLVSSPWGEVLGSFHLGVKACGKAALVLEFR